MSNRFVSLRSFGKVLGVLTLGVLLSRCGDEKVQSNYTSLHKHFFSGCGAVGCHVSGTTAYQNIAVEMNGSKDTLYATLTSTTLTYPNYAACNSRRIITANDYDQSMIKALIGSDSDRSAYTTANGGCSPVRSLDHSWPQPSDEVKTALQQWIAAGAANN